MSQESRTLILRRSAYFQSLSEYDLATLAEAMNEEHYQPGEIVLAAGEPADRIFVVVEGTLEIRPKAANFQPIHVGPGALFGEYGMFDKGQRTATVISVGEVRLLSLDYVRFRAFLMRFPEAMWEILGTTVRQLLAMQRGAKTR